MRSWLTRNVIVISLVSLMQDAASEIMYPLMPLFLTGVLVAPAIVLGIVEGSAELAMGISKYYAGRASDKYGRKTFISAGYGLAGIGKMVVASSVIWPTVLVGRVVDRIGKGIRSTPRDALLTNSVEPTHYSRVYGFHRSADTLGAVIGPIIALIGLSLLHNNVRAVMWWAIIPALLSLGLTFLIKDGKPKPEVAKAVEGAPMPRAFWTSAIPFIAVALTNLPDTMLLLRLAQIHMPTTHVVLAYIAFNTVYTLAAYPAGVIADKFSPHTVYAVGLIAFAITYITLGQLTSPSPVVYAVVALYGFFPALTDGVGKAVVSHTIPKLLHGRGQGIFQSLNGGAILIAGIWGGLLWSAGSGNGSVPLTIAGIGAGVAAIGMLAIARHRNSHEAGSF
jgi:MFS family permease